jgi:hypothetical protein
MGETYFVANNSAAPVEVIAQPKVNTQDQIEVIEKAQKQAILESYEKHMEKDKLQVNEVYTPIFQAGVITPFAVTPTDGRETRTKSKKIKPRKRSPLSLTFSELRKQKKHPPRKNSTQLCKAKLKINSTN